MLNLDIIFTILVIEKFSEEIHGSRIYAKEIPPPPPPPTLSNDKLFNLNIYILDTLTMVSQTIFLLFFKAFKRKLANCFCLRYNRCVIRVVLEFDVKKQNIFVMITLLIQLVANSSKLYPQIT